MAFVPFVCGRVNPGLRSVTFESCALFVSRMWRSSNFRVRERTNPTCLRFGPERRIHALSSRWYRDGSDLSE